MYKSLGTLLITFISRPVGIYNTGKAQAKDG